MLSLLTKQQNVFIHTVHEEAPATLEGIQALVDYFKDQNPEAAALLTKRKKKAMCTDET